MLAPFRSCTRFYATGGFHRAMARPLPAIPAVRSPGPAFASQSAPFIRPSALSLTPSKASPISTHAMAPPVTPVNRVPVRARSIPTWTPPRERSLDVTVPAPSVLAAHTLNGLSHKQLRRASRRAVRHPAVRRLATQLAPGFDLRVHLSRVSTAPSLAGLGAVAAKAGCGLHVGLTVSFVPKRGLSSISRSRLSALYAAAQRDPDNADKVANLYKEAVKEYPHEVVRFFESNAFAENEKTARYYIKAMSKLGKLDQISVHDIATRTGHVNVEEHERQLDDERMYQSQHEMMGRQYERYPQPAPAPAAGGSSFLNVAQLIVSIIFLILFGVTIYSLTSSKGPGLTPGIGTGKVEPVMEIPTDRFSDIKGCPEAVEDLQEVVEYLRSPEKFSRLGGTLPKGLLMVGEPGTGKTLLARAVAGEAGVPFFYCSGSQFEEVFVGLGARRIRELFEKASKEVPAIIFIDEIDAIGGRRNSRDHSSQRMTLNELLVHMDGFKQNEGLLVMGATNLPEILDKALTRPGRFDKQVVVPLPDVQGRKDIFKLYLEKVVTAPDVDPVKLARGTAGCTGAVISNMVNIAANRASVLNREAVTNEDLEYAKDKVLMGSERKSAVIPQKVLKMTAFHEGGHALVGLHTKGSLPIHKATIVPRGQALGMVLQLPEDDMLSYSRLELQAMMDVAMAGRASEEMVYGPENVCTGASNDIQKATEIATKMVTVYGMSDRVGPIYRSEESLENLSPQARQVIDEEVSRLLKESYDRASAMLHSKKEELHRLADALLEYETLTADEMKEVVAGRKLEKTI